MRKEIGLLLILGVSALTLAGCLYHRDAGPCYGVGCPSFTRSGAQKTAAVLQPAGLNAQAQASATAGSSSTSAAESSQVAPAHAGVSQSDASPAKPGKWSRMLSALHLH